MALGAGGGADGPAGASRLIRARKQRGRGLWRGRRGRARTLTRRRAGKDAAEVVERGVGRRRRLLGSPPGRGSRRRPARAAGAGSPRAAGAPPGVAGSAAVAPRWSASYLLPGSGLTDGRQESLRKVIADGPRRDPRKVGEFGERVAFVVGHGRYIASGTLQCQYSSPDRRQRLHIRSTSDRDDARQPGSEVDPRHTDKESTTMPRIFAAILLVAVLAIGGGIIATTAYQAGLSTAVTTADGGVAPRSSRRSSSPPTGTATAGTSASASGSSAFFATLFFLFIVFGLIRAIFWRGGRVAAAAGVPAAGAARRLRRQGPTATARRTGRPGPRDLRRLAPPGPRRRAGDRSDRSDDRRPARA